MEVMDFIVICSKCENQIKNPNIRFLTAKDYKFLECPICKNTAFRLIKEVKK